MQRADACSVQPKNTPSQHTTAGPFGQLGSDVVRFYTRLYHIQIVNYPLAMIQYYYVYSRVISLRFTTNVRR